MDKQNFYKELLQEEYDLLEEIKTLNETLVALQILKKRYDPKDGVGEKNINVKLSNDQIVSSDPPGAKTARAYFSRPTRSKETINSVLEALEFIEEGTAEAVGKTFVELNPDFPKEKAHRTAKDILSKLNQSGKISAEKVEGKNYFIYKFKKSS